MLAGSLFDLAPDEPQKIRDTLVQFLRCCKLLCKCGAIIGDKNLHDLEEDLFLVVEMIVQRCDVYARRFGDLARRGVVDALGDHDLERGVDDLLATAIAVGTREAIF